MEAERKDQPDAPLGKRISKRNPKYQSDSDDGIKNTSAVKQKRATKVVSKK